MPAVRWACQSGVPVVQRALRLGVRDRVRGVRRGAPALGALRDADPSPYRLTIWENRMTVTVSSAVTSRL
jgi:hypothetical protein